MSRSSSATRSKARALIAAKRCLTVSGSAGRNRVPISRGDADRSCLRLVGRDLAGLVAMSVSGK